MLGNIREDVTGSIARVQFRMEEPLPEFDLPVLPDFITTHIDPFSGEDNSGDIDGGQISGITTTLPRPPAGGQAGEFANLDISRNAPCPRSEEHTSELQSLMRNSYAVFCLKTQNTKSTQKPPADNRTQKPY